jgi:hypothetical protein
MVKELSEEKLNRKLFLQKVVRVRYFKAINPVDSDTVNVSLDISVKDGGYDAAATVFSGETVFSKLSLSFIDN